MNLVDTSGWIEYFFGAPNAAHFARLIEDTGNLIVPVTCLYEVFKKVHSVGSEAQALLAVAQMRLGRVCPLTEDLALSAALISLRHGMPMADSMILATARAQNAVLWTQDEHFRGLPGVEYLEAACRRPKEGKKR
jgi:predicted nucleic acid-binding protein